jgi:clan AA aspartic protease (TIGR02281 family)
MAFTLPARLPWRAPRQGYAPATVADRSHYSASFSSAVVNINRNSGMTILENTMRHACSRFILCCLVASCGTARASECSEQYFAPEDNDNAHALARPHGAFLKMRQAAKTGGAAEMRNLAVAYEAGYLVSQCEDKAATWYGRAAQAGDHIARQWMENHEKAALRRAGPECAGDHCFGRYDGEVRTAVFYSGRNGHYFAPVTINGVTEMGLIDTGSSAIAMSEETARSFGINSLSGDTVIATTANGNISARSVTVPSVSVSGLTLRNVRVTVGIQGSMLIGMSFLSRVNVRMEPGLLSMSK